MKTYKATVTREGKWWMVAIPKLNGLTQARRLAEAADMAREWIAVTLDAPIEEVAVEIAVADVAGVAVNASLERISEVRENIAMLEADWRLLTAELANNLYAADVPLRDIGTIMGVSFQRAHQLVTADN